MAMSQTQRRKAWRNIYMASWLVILMGVVYVQKQNQDALGRSLRRLKSSRNLSNNHRRRKLSSSTKNAIETKTENGRPIIYTYFEYNPDWEKGDFGSPEEQKEMLQTWARSWRNHGWEPKVLYKRHAEKHPYFEKFEEILDKVKIKYYDHICFHRWIAMSMYGGYMSDYGETCVFILILILKSIHEKPVLIMTPFFSFASSLSFPFILLNNMKIRYLPR
uniref:Uncharacterized protein n=1 Tax=Ditylum brightwellii TaxID=49249 RepID=A0A7S4SAE9_9STRA